MTEAVGDKGRCSLIESVGQGAKPETGRGLGALERVAPSDCPLLRMLKGEGEGGARLSREDWGQVVGKVERVGRDMSDLKEDFRADIEKAERILRGRSVLLALLGTGVAANAILLAYTALKFIRP